MIVLGIDMWSGRGEVAIVKDGQLIFVVRQDRIDRSEVHGLPTAAIDLALDQTGTISSRLDAVSFVTALGDDDLVDELADELAAHLKTTRPVRHKVDHRRALMAAVFHASGLERSAVLFSLGRDRAFVTASKREGVANAGSGQTFPRPPGEFELEAELEDWLRVDGRDEVHLCLAGEYVSNVRWSTSLARARYPHVVYAPPLPHGMGAAIGAAFLVFVEAGRGIWQVVNRNLGPSYGDADIDEVIERAGLHATRVEDPVATAAALVEEGRRVGWFQGRSALDDTGLGTRCVLCRAVGGSPDTGIPASTWPVGVVSKEAIPRFFGEDVIETLSLGTMLRARSEVRAEVAGITDAAGKAFVHGIRSSQNEFLHAILRRLDQTSGRPVVAQTPLLSEDGLIAESPTDALDAFLSGRADAMVMGHRLIRI